MVSACTSSDEERDKVAETVVYSPVVHDDHLPRPLPPPAMEPVAAGVMPSQSPLLYIQRYAQAAAVEMKLHKEGGAASESNLNA